jgi:hypothetical protein
VQRLLAQQGLLSLSSPLCVGVVVVSLGAPLAGCSVERAVSMPAPKLEEKGESGSMD